MLRTTQNRINGNKAHLAEVGASSPRTYSVQPAQKISEAELESRVAALSAMSIPELHDEWARVWGTRPYTRNYALLRRRIKWRLYTLCYGGLAVSELRKAEELADLTQLRERAPSLKHSGLTLIKETVVLPPPREEKRDDALAPMDVPGAYLRKQYNGTEHIVYSLGNGRFNYAGTVYNSLTPVAKAITGYKVSGRRFFSTSTTIFPRPHA